MSEAYIVAAARTAGGKRGGKLKDWHPVDLGARVIDSLLDRSNADPTLIEDVICGCVSQAGQQANNVARNAVMASRLPDHVPATTVDRQCGSSQQSLHFAAQAVMSGCMDAVIAMGIESMTRVPMGTPITLPAEKGMGTYMSPHLQAKYPDIQFSQFIGAEMVAKKYGLTKDQLDEFGYESHKKAIRATQTNKFDDEIVPLEINDIEGNIILHNSDEGIRYDISLEGIKNVKLLRADGIITAATSSQICDGASGVLIVNERGLKALGIRPMARIHQMTVIGGDPVIMLEAPLPATKAALHKAHKHIDDIDLFEVNEAFASVPVAWLKDTGAAPEKLNVHGGAIALGHPLGASGTKLMTTLLYALKDRDKRWGLQTMCEGGGLANVTIIERL
jgi:acetyl-CoA C-acetyltransferase